MTIQEQIPLAPYTTLGIGGPAEYFADAKTLPEIKEAVLFAQKKEMPVHILGEGSNTLIADEGVSGLVLHLRDNRTVFEEAGGDIVRVTAGAGANWDSIVNASIERGLCGIENLSFVPGSVGAAPVQNIGCYGQEIANSVTWVSVLDLKTLTTTKLSPEECQFGYRDSIFKKDEWAHLLILEVALELSKTGKTNTVYKDLKEHFSRQNIARPSLKEVRAALKQIRKRKFGTLDGEGTAGSFFKNPIVEEKHYRVLRSAHSALPGYPVEDGKVKIPLAWILDNILGLKGVRRGNVGLSSNQPLVLIAYEGATASEVKTFVRDVAEQVKEATDITIEWEVRMLG